MPDTLTARDKYHLKNYGSVDSPVRLAMKNGGSITEYRNTLLKQFDKGGFVNEKVTNDNTQVADAVASNVPNNVNDRIRPIEMSDEQYYKYLQSIQPSSTIKPLTPEQKRDVDVASDREYWTSDLYANQRIADAKKGISAATAVTSFIPGPIGVASRFINVGLDADQFAQDKDLWSAANATTGVPKFYGDWNLQDMTNNPKLKIPLAAIDKTADFIGRYDTADDLSIGALSDELKTKADSLKDIYSDYKKKQEIDRQRTESARRNKELTDRRDALERIKKNNVVIPSKDTDYMFYPKKNILPEVVVTGKKKK